MSERIAKQLPDRIRALSAFYDAGCDCKGCEEVSAIVVEIERLTRELDEASAGWSETSSRCRELIAALERIANEDPNGYFAGIANSALEIDPTPWCNACGAQKRSQCKCPPTDPLD